jgi:hypothetical protein
LPVNLDVVEVKSLQQGKVAVLSAEVVDRELDILAPQLGKALLQAVIAREQAAFGNFESNLKSGSGWHRGCYSNHWESRAGQREMLQSCR